MQAAPAQGRGPGRYLRSLLHLPFAGKRQRQEPPAEDLAEFGRLQRMSEEEWQAALIENPHEAARWVYAAAVYGRVDAQMSWGHMLLNGYGIERDPERAFRWFGIAAQSRRADTINMVGRCHELGWGVPVDLARAAACYREAAEKSYDWGQFNLASLMLEGKGVARDPDTAFDLFMKAAAQGHAKSMNMIGGFYEHGLGRPASMEIARDWYRRAAEGGDFRGRYRYGLLLAADGSPENALPLIRQAIDAAPADFCRDVALQLADHPHPDLRELAAHAQARAEAGRAG